MIETNDSGTGNDLNPTPPQEAVGKKILWAVIAIVILAALFFGINTINKNNRPSSDYTLKEIDTLEAEQQRKILEDQLREAEQQVQNLSNNADVSDRYTTYIRLADLQNRLGKYQDAIVSVDKIASENQGNSRVLLMYAIAYQGLGNKEKAKENILLVLALDDETAEHWLRYFAIFDDLNAQERDAKYTEALIKTKNNIELVKQYAKFLEQQGKKEKAVIYWETARNVDPTNAGEYEKEITRLRPPQQ